MAISFNNALGIHEQALRVRTYRAEVLANNLANADTPNYKARDIDFKSILQGQASMSQSSFGMSATHNNHLSIKGTSIDNDQLFRVPQQASVDGNTVEEQVEHANYMQNSLAFQASYTFLNSKFKGLMTAVRGE